MNNAKSPNSEFVGKRLENMRWKRGLTKKGLAEIADIDQHLISAFESGGRAPSREQVHRLAEALHVKESYFIWNGKAISPKRIYRSALRPRRLCGTRTLRSQSPPKESSFVPGSRSIIPSRKRIFRIIRFASTEETGRKPPPSSFARIGISEISQSAT